MASVWANHWRGAYRQKLGSRTLAIDAISVGEVDSTCSVVVVIVGVELVVTVTTGVVVGLVASLVTTMARTDWNAREIGADKLG